MKQVIFCIIILISLEACSPYFFLTEKSKKVLKDDYASRFDIIKTVANNIQLNANDTICDIGTGQGISISILASFLSPNTNYYVEDIDKKVCSRSYFNYTFKFIKAKTNIDNYNFFIGKKDRLPFESNSFNNITLFISIHEFMFKEKMLNEIHRILRDTGKLYILETVSQNNYDTKDEYCGFHYLQDTELNSLLSKANFKIIKDTIPHETKISDSTAGKFLILTKQNQ